MVFGKSVIIKLNKTVIIIKKILSTGSYWVFKIFEPNYDESSVLYCNKTVYLFAFVYLIVHYSVLLLIGVFFCCVITCACFIVKKDKKNANVEADNPSLRNGEP